MPSNMQFLADISLINYANKFDFVLLRNCESVLINFGAAPHWDVRHNKTDLCTVNCN